MSEVYLDSLILREHNYRASHQTLFRGHGSITLFSPLQRILEGFTLNYKWRAKILRYLGKPTKEKTLYLSLSHYI